MFDAAEFKLLHGAAIEESVLYADVSASDWMSMVDKMDPAEKVRIKQTPDFDRLIVERFDGSRVHVDGLGQAVFPLLRAFSLVGQQNQIRQSIQN